MRLYGRAAVSDFLGDRIVYRNLQPQDGRLPGLKAIVGRLGMPEGRVPRKSQVDYARVMVEMLRSAQEFDHPGLPLRRLVFIGDTRLNDGTAFSNLCAAGGWPGWIFIGSENQEPESLQVQPLAPGQSMLLANRWAALEAFASQLAGAGFPLDESTAVIADLDKTILGARGRNAGVIDEARVQAVRATVASALGERFDPSAFRAAYNRLNQVEFHPFTADNQDYLAYICLILGDGLFSLEAVLSDVRAGRLESFEQFIHQVEARLPGLDSDLADLHRQIFANVQAGDPTPFKAFRRNEYLATVGRMGCLADEVPISAMLEKEILLTQEVRQVLLEWGKQGALLFGLSDKPDEASIPTPELAAQGFQPIHRTPTHIVGSA